MTITLLNATLASLSPPRVQQASISVSEGLILTIDSPVPEHSLGAEIVDCSGRLVLPGNVCGHTHLYSSLARGMPGPRHVPRNFLQILERVWWKLDQALDEESTRYSALVGTLDAIRSGTTTLIDHHASPNVIDGSLDILAGAIDEVGARAVLCYEVTDRGGSAKSLAGLRENERFLRQNDRRLVSGMVGAHASFTLEDSTLTDLSELAAEYDVGVHIHVAEDMCDQADSLRRSNKRVVERLAQSGILTDRAIAAHAVHLDGTEIGLLQSSGSWIAHNCRSNMNNSVGRSPVSLLGDRVILGTDGLDGDMFTETRTAFLRSREDKLDTMAGDFISMLSAGASCATDIFGQPIGGMQPGSAADLVILDYDSPTPLTADNIAWHWIFGFSPAMVESVMVGGRWIMRNREFRGLDEEKVRAESRNQAKRLWDRMQEL